MSIEPPKLAVIPNDDTTASDRADYEAQGLGNEELLITDLRLTPQRQGSLDAYCGIYALINGFAYASRNSHKTRLPVKELFSLLIGRAQRVHGGHQVCLEGLTPAQLRQVALTAIKFLNHKGLHFTYRSARSFYADNTLPHRPDKSTKLRWLTRASTHPSLAVILYIENQRIIHWSILKSVAGDRVRLFDSDALTQVSVDAVRIFACIQHLDQSKTESAKNDQ